MEILSRDNFTCKICESKTRTLHVHHVEYLKGHDPWDYDNKYLVTYCESCHEIEHMFKGQIQDCLHDMRVEGIPDYKILEVLAGAFSKFIQTKNLKDLTIDKNCLINNSYVQVFRDK